MGPQYSQGPPSVTSFSGVVVESPKDDSVRRRKSFKLLIFNFNFSSIPMCTVTEI